LHRTCPVCRFEVVNIPSTQKPSVPQVAKPVQPQPRVANVRQTVAPQRYTSQPSRVVEVEDSDDDFERHHSSDEDVDDDDDDDEVPSVPTPVVRTNSYTSVQRQPVVVATSARPVIMSRTTVRPNGLVATSTATPTPTPTTTTTTTTTTARRGLFSGVSRAVVTTNGSSPSFQRRVTVRQISQTRRSTESSLNAHQRHPTS